jgi:acylphosphatase
MSLRRLLVRYSGNVQGVGFRASVRQIARGFEVKGWVKNLSDGGVEMLVSAEAKEVEAFLQAIRDSRLREYFDREVQESGPSVDLAEGFEIRYS